MRMLALFAILGLAGAAHADCEWQWACDGMNNCKHVPICESSMDIVPPEPPSIRPIAPPSIKPIPTPTIPPIGASSCEPVQICDSMGECEWKTICE